MNDTDAQAAASEQQRERVEMAHRSLHRGRFICWLENSAEILVEVLELPSGELRWRHPGSHAVRKLDDWPYDHWEPVVEGWQ